MINKVLFITLFCLSLNFCLWAQRRNVSPEISGNCTNSTITYQGIKMEYPLTVREAKEKYNLQYVPTAYFSKFVPSLPPYHKNKVPNFRLIYSHTYGWRDITPEDPFLEEPVKGYLFILNGATNTDSLLLGLENQFNGKFIKKENRGNRALNMTRGLFYPEMKLSDCIHIAVSDYGPQKALVYLSFHFDLSAKEVEWFPL